MFSCIHQSLGFRRAARAFAVAATLTLHLLACTSVTAESGFSSADRSPTEPGGSGSFGPSSPADGAAAEDAGHCAANFTGVVRDFNELHTEFVYRGGESFTFSGDDDLWIFVNRHLAIDLGGVHDAKSATIDFDGRAAELGLAAGGRYELSVFQAERHTPGSNFRIDTSVDFSNCDAIVR